MLSWYTEKCNRQLLQVETSLHFSNRSQLHKWFHSFHGTQLHLLMNERRVCYITAVLNPHNRICSFWITTIYKHIKISHFTNITTTQSIYNTIKLITLCIKKKQTLWPTVVKNSKSYHFFLHKYMTSICHKLAKVVWKPSSKSKTKHLQYLIPLNYVISRICLLPPSLVCSKIQVSSASLLVASPLFLHLVPMSSIIPGTALRSAPQLNPVKTKPADKPKAKKWSFWPQSSNTVSAPTLTHSSETFYDKEKQNKTKKKPQIWR